MRPLGLVFLLVVPLVLAGCAGPGEPAPGTPTGSTGGTSFTPSADGCVSTLDASVNASEPIWVLETSMGTIRMTLFCDKTPITAQNIVNLTEQGYFDGIKFHRVIENFMNQGGDPLTKDESRAQYWGTGGPTEDGQACSQAIPELPPCKRIPDEFYCADGTVDYEMNSPQYPGRPAQGPPHQACDGNLGLKHDSAGVLSMANAGPNTGGSQFFITAVPTPSLDGAHPVFGRTADEESLGVVLEINRVPTDAQDRPRTPVVIQRATIEWS